MRSGSQVRTSGGSAGCITETPNAITTVAAHSSRKSGAAPRSAQPSAVTRRPAISVARAPSRAISSEPGTAASMNSTGGSPDRMPTCVSLKDSSSWIARMSGGTARMVRRRPTPAIHSIATQVTKWPSAAWCRAAASLESMGESRQRRTFSPAALSRADDRLQPLFAHDSRDLGGAQRLDEQSGGGRPRAFGEHAGREHRHLLHRLGKRPDDVDAVDQLELAHLLDRDLDLAARGKRADHAVEDACLARDLVGDAELADQVGEVDAARAAARERDRARRKQRLLERVDGADVGLGRADLDRDADRRAGEVAARAGRERAVLDQPLDPDIGEDGDVGGLAARDLRDQHVGG